ncbi:MAG: glycoside hydrolase family 31 protein [Clostridia bacterium]|nr:glycoside hydrolase family 31 protein [Clostridia bacterium]
MVKIANRSLALLLVLLMLLPMLLSVRITALENDTETSLYAEGFDAYAEKEAGTPLVKGDGFANTTPSSLTVAREDENTYLKMELTSPSDPNQTVHYLVTDGAYTLVEEGTPGALTTDLASYGLISGSDPNLNKNLQLKQPALDYETTPVVVLQLRYYISEDAKGTLQSQFLKYSTDGGDLQNWFGLYTIDTATGVLNANGSANEEIRLKRGDWSTVSIVLDLVNGTADYYIDRQLAAYQVNIGKTKLVFSKDSWIIGKVPRTRNAASNASADLSGYVCMDDAAIYVPKTEHSVSFPAENEKGEQLICTQLWKDGSVCGEIHYGTTVLCTQGVTASPVYFDSSAYGGLFSTESEISLRLFDQGGIRFVNSLNLGQYAILREMEAAGEITDLQFGTLIAPQLYIDRAGAFTVSALETVSAQVSYVTVRGTYGEWYENDTEEDGLGTFAGTLANVRTSHYNDAFVGRGYVSFKLPNGRTQYLYGAYGAGASVSALAEAALAESVSYTKGEKDYLTSFEAQEFSMTGSAVQDVYLIDDVLFFRVGTAYAALCYAGDSGWRLKARSAEHLGFEGYGAAQALALYMNETPNDTVLPIFVSQVADDRLRVTTADGTYVELTSRSFNLNFYSASGRLTTELTDVNVTETGMELVGWLEKDEGIFGGGERFDTVNKRGSAFTLYATDRWNNSGATYMAIPLFTTSRGGGIYVNRYESMAVDFEKSARNVWSLSLRNELLDCYVFASDDMKDAITGYTKLTGNADLPAEWAYGVMICRYSKDFQTFEYDQVDAEGNPVLNRDNAPSGRSVKTIVNELINAGMKPSSVVLEPWGYRDISGDSESARAACAELQKTIDWLDELDIKTMLYMAVGSSITPQTMVGFKEEYFVHAYVTVDGKTQYTTYLPQVAGDGKNPDSSGDTRRYLDITNPEAVEWYFDVIWGQLIDMGVDGVKIDFCEQFPDEDYDYNGTTVVFDWYDSSLMPQGGEHHSYPTYFISAFYKRMNELKQENGETDGFYVLSRGGGIGSQRNPYLWAGDQTRNFDKLDDQLLAVVNSGLSGVPFMTYDMAGYRYAGGGTTYASADSLAYESEIFARAIEFTAFMPNIQTHGTVRNVYELTEDAQRIYHNFLALREKLTPYITKYTEIACETGIPVVRHPILHYQNDPEVCDISTQFMLGDGLMIAPILSRTDGTRTVYLPEGSWTNLLTGETVSGNQTLAVTANLGQIPVFLNNDSADAEMLREIFESDTWDAIKNWK